MMAYMGKEKASMELLILWMTKIKSMLWGADRGNVKRRYQSYNMTENGTRIKNFLGKDYKLYDKKKNIRSLI